MIADHSRLFHLFIQEKMFTAAKAERMTGALITEEKWQKRCSHRFAQPLHILGNTGTELSEKDIKLNTKMFCKNHLTKAALFISMNISKKAFHKNLENSYQTAFAAKHSYAVNGTVPKGSDYVRLNITR